MTARFASLISTGRYLPPLQVPNAALQDRWAATAPDFVPKMEARSGIRTRWYAPDDWVTSDLALAAARDCLRKAKCDPEELDLILLGTDTPDYISPATSSVLQFKLGATRAGTFDVGCACASFPTGFAAAAGFIASNPSLRRVLVVGVYLMHRLADPGDPSMFFYGDGAGAALLGVAERPGFVASALQADGSFHRRWGIFSGGTAEPASEASVREGRTRCRLLERYPAEVNEEGWPRLVQKLAENGRFPVDAIDLIIFTQVNRSVIESVMEKLRLPLERTHMVMDKWGYTGSACIPMALDDAIDAGRARAGQLVCLVGSGVGYNQAAVAFRMPG